MAPEEISVIVVGSGPASYTAALYLARAHLDPLILAGFKSGPVGGQLMTTTEVENFPGFPDGITGPELMEKMRRQSEKFGSRILEEDVTSIEQQDTNFLVQAGNKSFLSKGVIIATGATAKKLNVSGVDLFWQKGISACAVCDGALPLFRNQPIAVIGGGDSAMEEALFLTRFASKVYVIHRRDRFRASPIMSKRVLSHAKIEVIWNATLEKVEGSMLVESITLKNTLSKESFSLAVKGLFFAIGHSPNTEFLGNLLDLDQVGYILTAQGTSRTSRDGIFAAGDVIDPHYRQAITAAGSGCIAALDCERWLAPRFP